MRKRRVIILISLCCLFFLSVGIGPVAAHGYLVRAIPADRSVLERPPTRLQYWFSESLEPRFSQINVRDVTGQIRASGGVDPNNSTALMVQIPPGTLTDGAYVVELRLAFASDSHAIVESRVFFVGDAASDVAGIASNPYAQPLEIAWKALLMGGTFLLFGAFAVYALVLIPAWGSAQHRLGHLPLRLISRLHYLIIIGIVISLAANVFALIQQTMTFFNVDAATAISTDMWQIVRTSSRAGDVWTLRMVLLVVLAFLHGAAWYFRETWPNLLRPIWTGNLWLMALMVGLQAVASHAAGALVQPWIAMALHWTHALAAAFWIGGIAVLVLSLPTALQPYAGEERQQALTVVMKTFSRLIVGVVALVIMSGIYNALNWFYTPQDAATSYGGTLLLKVLMVALLLGFGAVQYLALNPDRRMKFKSWARRLIPVSEHVSLRSLRWESLVGAIVLASAAALSATPIPQPVFLQTETPSLTRTQTVDDITATLTASPGVIGINTFDILIERDDQPITDAQVEIQLVLPVRDRRTRWDTAEHIEQGLYVWASDAIDTVGEWTFLLDVTEANGDRTRIAFTQGIEADPIIIRSLSPLQALALILTSGIIAWIFWPQARAFALFMNWDPKGLFVAMTVILATVILLWIGALWIEDQTRRTEEQLNPLPQIINPTLPDQASLQRGEALYDALCRDWEDSEDFEVLLRQIDLIRDEELYRIPARGWRSLPACSAPLTEDQTWDLVNDLRTRRVIREIDSR